METKLNSTQPAGKLPRTGVRNALRVVAFLAVFALCLYRVQDIVVPNRDLPDDYTRFTKSIHGLLNEKKDSLDILWVGTSHIFAGISPMEVYRDTGIRSHLIGGSSQRAASVYYLLKEAMKRQSPKLVILDVSCLTYRSSRIAQKNWWQYSIDALPFSSIKTRIEMADKLAELNDEPFGDEYIARSVLPIFQYHTNLNLTENDWLDTHLEQVYYKKGHRLSPTIRGVAEELEAVIDELIGDADEDEEDLAELDEDEDSDIARIVENNRVYLEDFINLCQNKGSELVLIKVPVRQPTNYRGYWSLEKHQLFQELADEYGLTFLDLNYEDVGIDWDRETADGGRHLNTYGATRLSRFMAQWLTDNYDIEGVEDDSLKAQWDTQLELYDWERSKYWYTAIKDLSAYFEALRDPDYTVLINVNGDVSGFWTDELQEMFTRATGCKSDLRAEKNAAFTLVCSGGKVIHKENGKRGLEYHGTFEDGTAYTLTSSVNTNAETGKIRVNHQTLTTVKGLQIAVYDNELHSPVDCISVWFNEELGEAYLRRRINTVFKMMSLAIAERSYEVIASM